MHDQKRSARVSCALSILVPSLFLVAAGCGDTKVNQEGEVGISKSSLSTAPTAPASGGGIANGKRVVWVKMRERASLSSARGITGWKARGEAVRNSLQATASRSQASLRSFLTQRRASFRSFYIANVVRVEADAATIAAIEKRSDVAEVLPDRTYSVPPAERTVDVIGVQQAEWGLESIRAPEAWDEFGVKGEGIVVANIDTGVQFDHPAFRRDYDLVIDTSTCTPTEGAAIIRRFIDEHPLHQGVGPQRDG